MWGIVLFISPGDEGMSLPAEPLCTLVGLNPRLRLRPVERLPDRVGLTTRASIEVAIEGRREPFFSRDMDEVSDHFYLRLQSTSTLLDHLVEQIEQPVDEAPEVFDDSPRKRLTQCRNPHGSFPVLIPIDATSGYVDERSLCE